MTQPPFESSILIVGICRNVGAVILDEIRRLDSAFSRFQNREFLLIESDSSDDTVLKLYELKSSYKNLDFVTLGNLEEKIPERIARISYCRNRYLEALRSDRYATIKYLVVSDLDGVNSLLTGPAVESCWVRDDWAAVTANQMAPYYDIYALRHSTWSPNDCWEFERQLRQQGTNSVRAREIAVYSRQITIASDQKWIEVDSAFGGLGIYKVQFLKNCSYSPFNPDGSLVCEHVTLNRQIRANGGQIYVNPRLINFAWNSHNIPNRLVMRMKRKVKQVVWHVVSFLRAKSFR
jgi:hypothetical protein